MFFVSSAVIGIKGKSVALSLLAVSAMLSLFSLDRKSQREGLGDKAGDVTISMTELGEKDGGDTLHEI